MPAKFAFLVFGSHRLIVYVSRKYITLHVLAVYMTVIRNSIIYIAFSYLLLFRILTMYYTFTCCTHIVHCQNKNKQYIIIAYITASATVGTPVVN